jgi:acyl transferase domain-containing protein/acyl carrier protein/ribosomal protein S18 acetylase RimI-like enzyme
LAGSARTAQTLLSRAGEAWFVRPECWREPRWSAGSFERRPYRVRPAQAADLTTLVELERRCWPEAIAQSEAALERRLERHPETNLVLELEHGVVAVIYAQRIADEAALLAHSMATVESLHRPDGELLQLLAVNVQPAAQDRALGDQLLEFMLKLAQLQPELTRVVGVTRCKDYPRHAALELDDYIRLRNERGSLVDTTLRFHENHGATIVRVLPGYRPNDEVNRRAGVLVRYELEALRESSSEARVVRDTAAQRHEPRAFIEREVSRLLGPTRVAAYAADRPLMEMGLDSGDLLELGESVQAAFAEPVGASFFFEHNTVERIVIKLEGKVAPASRPQPRSAQRDEPVALIGIACRLPGEIDSPSEFWRALREGRDCVGQLPEGRWSWPSQVDLQGTHQGIDRGGFLRDVEQFDPAFFRLTPREAELLDPQQRLLLTLSWSCLEHAGYAASALAGSATGVFVGASGTDHVRRLACDGAIDPQYALATAMSVLANRISYFYDFHGPSAQVDTACSSSLVAVHQALQALRAGECEQALVGGVHLMQHPALTLAYHGAGMLSKRGRCAAFSADADGYVRSEGALMVLLKPLARALDDGDTVWALLRGSAVNHGGRAAGLTVPNPSSQAALVAQAYRAAGIDLRRAGYIEAHGTGTPLGDPIEIKGLRDAFAAQAIGQRRCAVGSVKTNLGHLEAAAGLAGLIKVALCLREQTQVASLHCSALNPRLELTDSGLHVADRCLAWATPDDLSPRVGSVSSFGSGGTNAHVVLEEYAAPAQAPVASLREPALFVLSARTSAALRRAVERLIEHLDARSALDLRDVAYTLQVGREAFEHRLAAIADERSALLEKLRAFLAGRTATGLWHGAASERPAPSTHALFERDDDLRAALQAWLHKRKLEHLAELWVAGYQLPFAQLYERAARRKLELPSYPFERAASPPSAAADQPAEPARAQAIFAQRWQPARVGTREIARPLRTCIVYTPEVEAFATRLAQMLQVHGQVELCLQCAFKGDYAGDAVVDLVGCAPAPADDLQWLPAVQALARASRTAPKTWLCVTRGLESGTPPAGELGGALRAGLARALGAEYPALRACHVDLDAGGDVDSDAAFVAHELRADGDGCLVYYCQGVRHEPRLAAVPEPSHGAALAFPPDRALVVSGGTRGIGLLCARHMVRHYGVRRVVLLGKEPLPARANWQDAARSEDALGRKLRGLLSLVELGAEVTASAVDLGDRAALEREATSWGPVGGVLHAAGLADWQTLAFVDKSIAGIRAVLAPKIRGAEQLFAVLAAQPLRFFVLFSSVSAVLPTLGAGQSDYAMANRYLDAFARTKAHQAPVMSLQWPSWRDSGMGEVKTPAYRSSGLLSLQDAEGLQLLDRALALRDQPVVLPAVFDPARFPADALEPKRVRAERPCAKPAQPTSHDGAAATQALLRRLFAEELKLPAEQIDARREFRDWGVDSILLTQLLKRIGRELGRELSPTLAYEHPSLAALASALGEVEQDQPATVQWVTQAAQCASSAEDPLVIVAMSCRFAGAPNLEAYWSLLRAGGVALRAVPPSRWSSSVPRFAGLLEALPTSAVASGLWSEDARAMDPQALLLLAECERMLHGAGYEAAALQGSKTGVYVGARSDHRPPRELLDQMRHPILALGQNYLAANLSQRFDLQGPSSVIDTACSSSLIALKQAALALRCADIDQAIVAGVSLLSDERYHELFARRGILSPDATFHLFDRRAHGVVLGEGVGLVLIKRLSRALADGDRVHAVLRAIECNNDGRTAGPAAPNLKTQRAVMERALARAGVAPRDVGYVELNGTGSELTDLLELKAVQDVYGRPADGQPCLLGSVKPNIGHTLCAEGIAALIKVSLMLARGTLLPFASGGEPSPHHDLSAGGLAFAQRTESWSDPRRIAALNCFADGGTNVHVLLESWSDSRAAHELRGGTRPPPSAGANRWRRNGGSNHG